jgi:hypothetical protein
VKTSVSDVKNEDFVKAAKEYKKKKGLTDLGKRNEEREREREREQYIE